MDSIALLEPFTINGLRTVKFFNGRLLSAEDLRKQAEATDQAELRIGRAIGEGIAFGLDVASVADAKALQVTVSKGLAVSREGRVLSLGADVTVSLVQPPEPRTATKNECVFFTDCFPPQSGTSVAGAGIYLLTIAPACAADAKAVVSGLGNGPDTCNTRYILHGVQFKMIQVSDVPVDVLSDVARLRNRLAYRCFGMADPLTEALVSGDPGSFLADPFKTLHLRYGSIDKLRTGSLGDCEVPLALLYLTNAGGVEFVDMWSVRRRIIPPNPVDFFTDVVGSRRPAEAEAAFLQFQEQIAAMLAGTAPQNGWNKLAATDRFDFLPPAGFLPIGAERFSIDGFFAGFDFDLAETDGAFVRQILHDSFYLDPVKIGGLEKTDDKPRFDLFTFGDGNDKDHHPRYALFVRERKAADPVTVPTPQQPAEQVGKGAFSVTVNGVLTLPTNIHVFAQSKADNTIYEAEPVMSRRELTTLSEASQFFAEEAYHEAAGINAALPKSKQVMMSRMYKGPQSIDMAKAASAASFANKITGLVKYNPGSRLSVSRTYRIPNVPTGEYFVKATAQGWSTASASATIEGGRTAPVSLLMNLFVVNIPKEPRFPLPLPGLVDSKGNRYGKIGLPDLIWQLTLPDPPPDELETLNTPPEVLRTLANKLQERLNADPTTPITTSNVSLKVRKDYDPTAGADEPYAFLTTDGASVPVVLSTESNSFPTSVSASRADVAELKDDSFVANLRSAGIGDADMLGAAWSALVADATGIPTSSAQGVRNETRTQLPAIRANRGYYPTVTSDMGSKLQAANLDDAALANQTVEGLRNFLPGVSDAQLHRLIDQARSFTPASFWSLSASNLGLKQSALDSLAGLKIDSQGALKAKLDDNAVREAAGLKDDSVAAMKNTIDENLLAASAAMVREAPLMSLDRVNADNASKLVEAGFTSINAVANASPENVAAVTGMPLDSARAVVRDATLNTLVTHVGLSVKDATAVLNDSPGVSLSEVASPGNAAVSHAPDVLRGRINALPKTLSNANELRNRTLNLRGMR